MRKQRLHRFQRINTDYNSRNTSCRSRAKSNKYAFTVAELLLALAISSILLAAVATAFNASIINYRDNEDMFKIINSARQALFRLTSQLRTADAVEPNSPSNECSLITNDGDNITYRFNNVDNKLYLITNDDLSDPDYVLCDNVTAMTFTKETVIEDGLEIVRSVQVSITVSRGNVERKISAAAVVRRNLSW
jgi:prepilin-type N-terminal cleavage/methylation domain-containing protein